jgi:capsular polysaccharide export protein
VSSQLGFEAILAGHKPVVLGRPFYMGWGLTDDRTPLDRRQRRLTRAQLFAAAMILYPTWYDPYRDRLCSFEDALATLEAETRTWREDHQGWVGAGMRLWKRAPMSRVFGQHRKMRFADGPAAITRARIEDRRIMVWAGKTTGDLEAAGAVLVEDGFLRSRGLGADLIPPLSLVLDDLGIYYDPSRESRLEWLINRAEGLRPAELDRARALITRIHRLGLSKYNLGGAALPEDLPSGRRILVPGQVEDDASIRLGATDVATNRALLEATRTANPSAILLYKPHPDVEAGLRPGAVPDAAGLADVILDRTDPVAALEAVDEVWTMTSALGFEALLRGRRVTCLGQPFYAGWGLTDDRAMPILRRTARPGLEGLVHATLIAYPRYHDPLTGRPCPVEVAVERLASGTIPRPGRANRALAKLQGAFASYAHLWR